MLSPVVMDCRKHRQISYDMPVELISKSPDKLLLLFIIYRYGSCPSYHEMLWFPSGLSFTTWTGSICRTINGFVKLLLVRFRSFLLWWTRAVGYSFLIYIMIYFPVSCLAYNVASYRITFTELSRFVCC